MELHQLRYIVALFQERNFLRAAKRVHITQPTLSHQIKKLEDELGSPLFERSAQGVRLTAAGEKFLPYAMATLDHLEKGLAQFREETHTLSGEIALGAIPTISPYFIPEVLIRTRKEAPSLKVVLYEETTSALLASLKAGRIDLGILALPVSDAGIASRSIGTEEFLLAVAKAHPLAAKKQVNSKMIEKEKLLILQEGHCFADQALEYCKRRRQDTQISFQGSSLTSVMKLAACGEGLTLVPKMAANPKENPDLRFIPFSAPKPRREIGLVWRLSAPLTPAHRFFIESAAGIFKSLTAR